MRSARAERLVIGLCEFVDIAEWRVRGLRAKVDTGARSSALHVEHLREVGRDRVRFDVRLHRSKTERRVSVEAPIVRRARVRASTGVASTRIFVAVTVRIGPFVERIELGLVDRANMLYRMLLGRTALGSHFLVDPCRRYLLTAAARASARPRPKQRPKPSDTRRGA
ncbi:MAG: RimK/LysX family protein [Polyangiaceae bacterium]